MYLWMRKRERDERKIIINIRPCLHSPNFQHKGDESDTSQLVSISDYIVVFTLKHTEFQGRFRKHPPQPRKLLITQSLATCGQKKKKSSTNDYMGYIWKEFPKAVTMFNQVPIQLATICRFSPTNSQCGLCEGIISFAEL